MRIIITEQQLGLLREAALDSFNTETLSNIKTFKDRLIYCRQNLGAPIGNGSSRIVYQIDDEKVLKLAKNQRGLAQNEYEGQPDYYKDELSIFPKKFQTAEDYTWIISEYVLPATENDFQECVGMSFNEWKRLVTTLKEMHTGESSLWHKPIPKETVWKLCETNPIIYDLNDFIGSYDNFAINDLYIIQNYGLALRNNKPWIVILDSGLSKEIFDRYYSS